jgi:AcrR family transcriptional regulator
MVEQQKSRERSYRLGRRQATLDETRDRIAAAAFALHGEVGPMRTTISAIAERAGVQRHTVYNHFPDLATLFEACTAHGMRIVRVPEPAEWRAIADPLARLRFGLDQLYGTYRANARSLGPIFRDIRAMGGIEGTEAFTDRLSELFAVLADGWGGDARSQTVRRAAIGHAMQFETWQSLTSGGLSDEQVRELMVGLIAGADALPKQDTSAMETRAEVSRR